MSAPALNFPALHASHAGIWIATPDGTVREVGKGEAIARAAETPMILLNAPLTGQRLGYADISGLDLLELFAFVHPAKFAVPTPAGLARALGLWMEGDDSFEHQTHTLPLAGGELGRAAKSPSRLREGLGVGLLEAADPPPTSPARGRGVSCSPIKNTPPAFSFPCWHRPLPCRWRGPGVRTWW